MSIYTVNLKYIQGCVLPNLYSNALANYNGRLNIKAISDYLQQELRRFLGKYDENAVCAVPFCITQSRRAAEEFIKAKARWKKPTAVQLFFVFDNMNMESNKSLLGDLPLEKYDIFSKTFTLEEI